MVVQLGSQKYRKTFKEIILTYLGCSQIWLNLPNWQKRTLRSPPNARVSLLSLQRRRTCFADKSSLSSSLRSSAVVARLSFFDFFCRVFSPLFSRKLRPKILQHFYVCICDEDVVKSGRAEKERAAARAASPELRRFVDNSNQGREGGRRSRGERDRG